MYGVAMRRWAPTLAVFGLAVAACGGAQVESTFETVPPPASTAAPSTSQAPQADADPETTTTAAPAPVVVDGPPAPDFTLALADGKGDFVLSAEHKPVYMVFWAEW